MGRNTAYISPAQRRRIANSPAVQAQIKARAARGLAAFRGAVKKRSGDAARHSELRPTKAPRSGVKGTAIVAYPGAPGTRNPNAPVPILFGTARQAGDDAMQVARRAVEAG